MKSLRANTLVADPDRMDVRVRKSDAYAVGWRKVGGRNSRCVRVGSEKGPVVSLKSVVDLCVRYVKGQIANVYSAVDYVEGAKEVSSHYVILATDMKTARKFAEDRHRKRVRRYSGMARFALTYAMMQTSRRSSPDKSTAIATATGKGTAMKNVLVNVRESGYDSGEVSIDVHDGLEYATGALKDGEGYGQVSVQKAVNGIVGMINRHIDKVGSFHDRLKVPFPKE